MNKKNFPVRRPVILLVIFLALFLSACNTVQDNNWPGLASDGRDVVYVSYGENGLIAYDVGERSELWSVVPDTLFPDSGRTSPPIYAAPSLSDGRLIIGDYGASGGFLSPRVQVNVFSLEQIDTSEPKGGWTASDRVQDRIIAQALQVNDKEFQIDDQVFIGTNDNIVLALNATTGDLVWPTQSETEQGILGQIGEIFEGRPCDLGCFEAGHSIWGRMTYESGVLYVPSLDTNVYALDAKTLEELWSSNVGGSVSDKIIINDDLIFASSFDQNLYALDKKDGAVRWTVEADASIWGAPAYEDGVVYFVDIDGNVRAIEATNGELLWKSALDQYVIAAPVIFDGKVYIASAGDPEISPNDRTGALIALDSETGDETWRGETQLPLFSTPVIAADSIAIAMNGQDVPLELKFYDLENLDTNWTFIPNTEGG